MRVLSCLILIEHLHDPLPPLNISRIQVLPYISPSTFQQQFRSLSITARGALATYSSAVNYTCDCEVTDAVWQQLQINRIRAEREKKAIKERLEKQAEELRVAEEARIKAEAGAAAAALKPQESRDTARALELRMQQTVAENQAVLARPKQREAERQLDLSRRQEDQRNKEEQHAREKITQMGLCPQGFAWIKQQREW